MAEEKAVPLTQRLDELFQPWNRSDAPGFVVAVAQRGELLYRRAFGLASVQHGLANLPATRMRIGSTTKHLCALSVLLLEEEGKLALDAPVRSYLPELSGIAGAPTLLQLLQHTGGVRDPFQTQLFLNKGVYGHGPVGSSLQLMRRYTESNFAPGENFAYCNSGYTLLSLVVERLSGKSLKEFFRERLFAPLDMRDTELMPSDRDLLPNLADFHVPQPGGGWKRGIYPSDELLGSGGVISSIDDMLVWMAHLRAPQKRFGKPATWARMLERPRYANGLEGVYCLALIREAYRGVELVHHAGATLGCQSQMLMVPEHGLYIIVMSNRMDGPAPAMANKIVDLVLEKQLKAPLPLAEAAKYPGVQGRWFSARERKLIGIAPAKAPQPEAPEGLMLTVYGQPTGLLVEDQGLLKRAVTAMEPLSLRPPPAGAAQPATLDANVFGREAKFERLPEQKPEPAAIAGELCGRYRYTEFGTHVDLVLRDGKLLLDFTPDVGKAQWEMEMLTPELALLGVLHSEPPFPLPNPAQLMFKRDAGGVRGFWLTTDRVRDYWFERSPAGAA